MSNRKKLSEKNLKALWALSGGVCSNPSCNRNIIEDTNQHSLVIIGEQAHIIAHSADGPRSKNNLDRNIDVDSINNLILLCSSCHTLIDKAEKDFPLDLLTTWKQNHEDRIRSIFREKKFNNLNLLKNEIQKLLEENHYLFMQYGPHSKNAENLLSNTVEIWHAHIVENILPNNRKIINLIENNLDLWTNNFAFIKFKTHATAYERHFINPIESYQLFPTEFSEYINE